MRDLQLVIFDCDGVLVDSERLSNDVLAQMLSEQGLPTTLAEARRDYQGLLLADIGTNAEAKLGRALPDGWLAEFERVRSQVFARDLEAVSGTREAIVQITTARLRVCVASQGKLEKTRMSLDLTGLHDLFCEQAIFSAYSVPRGKPYPDLFLHAAETMRVEPARCVVVEDTPSGVTAAVAAGMPVLGYAADSDPEALRRAGAKPFVSMRSLPALLGIA
jgi:beta-phosphoglucomutase-like phosphatase (HAD superfamily)